MATLTISNIRAHNIHPGATAHITGKSHTYVLFEVNGVNTARTTDFDSEASSMAQWRDVVKMNLDNATGSLKVTVYNKRKLIHDHEIGSSHIDLVHLTKSRGAEVRMVLMGKGQQQGEISFLPELRSAGGASAPATHHKAPAVAAGGLATAGHANYSDTNPAVRRPEISPEANHGPGLGGASTVARDKAAVSSGAAVPAAPGGYASHVAAPGATSGGVPVGHGEYVNHDKPAAVTAGFGGGGAAAFDNRGLATGKAHPDNRPPAVGASGAYPTSGSGVSDPAANLTNPVGDRSTMPGAGAAAAAGLGAGALAGEHKDGAGMGGQQGGTVYEKARDTATAAAAAAQQGAYNLKDRVVGPSSGSTATHEGPTMYEKARDTVTGTAAAAQEGAYNLKDGVMGPSSGSTTTTHEGPTMYEKVRDTVTGTAAAAQQGAYDLKDRMMGSSAGSTAATHQGPTLYEKARDTVTGTAAAAQQGAYNLKDRVMGSSADTAQVGAPSETHMTTTHVGGSLSADAAEHKEYASALEPVAGGAPAAGGNQSLLGRAVGAAVDTAGAAVSTVASAPRAAINTATGITQSAYNTATGATQAVYHAVAGGSPTTAHGTSTTTTGVEGAKPTLTERAKGLTATAIDTTTHLLDQATIHVTGHGTGEPVEAPKTMTGTAMAYTAKAIDLTTSVLDTAKEKIVGHAEAHPTSHVLPEQ